ncbi:MAG: hypothetical protein KC766_14490 [Myxococcales bacterium]|nr:hypothetical protein [Myxococcales bacterium]
MVHSRGLWLGATLALTSVACDSKSEPAPSASQSATSTSAAPSPSSVPLAPGVRPLVPRGSASVAQRQTLTALTGPKRLTLAGPRPVAELTVPVGQTLTQPLLVVLTTPETAKQCETWQRIKPAVGFMLCPTPASNSTEVVQHTKSAVKALEAKFGQHVGPRSTLVGYGAGADAAVALMRESPILFPRGFLIGGGV